MASLASPTGALPPTVSEARTETQDKNKAVAAREIKPEDYTKPFCEFLQGNPTVFHAVDYFKSKAKDHGYTEVRTCVGCVCSRRANVCDIALSP